MSNKCKYCWWNMLERRDSFVYWKSYWRHLWVCSNFPKCDAYSKYEYRWYEANKELRELRQDCHCLFDKIRINWYRTKDKCYKWLYEFMWKSKNTWHIWKFNKEECNKLIAELDKYTHIFSKEKVRKLSWTKINLQDNKLQDLIWKIVHFSWLYKWCQYTLNRIEWNLAYCETPVTWKKFVWDKRYIYPSKTWLKRNWIKI